MLDLHSNQLLADIGDVISLLPNLELVDLSSNRFYGDLELSVENVSGLASTIEFLNLSNNGLSGGFFGEDSMKLFRNLQTLDLSDNLLRGKLPTFKALSNLRTLRLGRNLLFGSVPEELLLSSMSLVELDLGGNGFIGSIAFINSTTLDMLNLSSNGLSGPLPRSLSRSTVVDLSRNMFSGDKNWEDTLEFIYLSSNKLSGSLPPVLGIYSKLLVVDLSLNALSGSIPGSLVALSSLAELNLSGNQFTGPLPLQISGTSELLLSPPMEFLDASNNSLEGDLPSDIGKMALLKLLNFARNGFSKELPNELSKLIYLEFLDLANNKFVGKISDKLSPNLTVFKVSNNDLSVRIPKNLKRFPTSSFRPGNEKLNLPNNSPLTSDNIPQLKGNIVVQRVIAG